MLSLKAFLVWLVPLFLMAGTLPLTQAKVYGFCELAKLLHNKHGIAKSELPNWLCLVRWESSYDTTVKHLNAYDGSTDWGLFQINDRYWCDPANGKASSNSCRVKCSKFLGANQDEAVKCVRKIYKVHGFSAWTGWKNHCRGKRLADVKRCF
ncbi:lysozyme c-1-like [Armigeres subalbatus]|uniref:lysozyme c-1-like n=1 Tax=Armigeres subalbatus TaxID=124917 RepID=UPI002ED3DB32